MTALKINISQPLFVRYCVKNTLNMMFGDTRQMLKPDFLKREL